MSVNNNGWQPCLADSLLGVAFFDGIRIDTDRITDPRWNRVFPIQEEEQIVMCRAMLERGVLKPGSRVLDVGTGSGVFAIWAAAHGCDVLGIDISARAISFARNNQSYECNSRELSKARGKLKFRRVSIEEFAEHTPAGTYDVVLLNPPYNPTATNFRPAQHADAGPHGQDKFREQLHRAWRLVGDNGIIVGHQMAFHESGRASEWWAHEVSEARRKSDCKQAYSLKYAATLDDTVEVPAQRFLSKQYAHFLHGESDPELKVVVERYIRGALDGSYEPSVRERPVFGLYYYEIRKLTNSAEVSSPVEPVGNFKMHLPHKNWNDRISLHRAVVEHTTPQTSFQVPSLFLENDFAPFVPKATAAVSSSIPDATSRSPTPGYRDSIQAVLGRWMAQVRFFGDPLRADEVDQATEPGFDFVIIEISPWFTATLGKRALRQEVAVYARKDYCESGDQLAESLALYQKAVHCNVAVSLAPFFHPYFSRQCGRNAWGVAHYRVMDAPELPSHLLTKDEKRLFETWTSAFERKFQELSSDDVSTSEHIELIPADAAVAFNNSKTLDELEVPVLAENMTRLQRDYPGVEVVLGQSNPLERDLELIHLHYHQHLRSALGVNARDPEMKTTLIGMPLALMTRSQSDLSDKVPDDYRGGIWIFAGARSQRRFGPRQEAMLLDLARLTVLLASSVTEAKAVNALREGLDFDYFGAFAHEIKHLVDGIAKPKAQRNDLVEIWKYFSMLALSEKELRNPDKARQYWIIIRGLFGNFCRGATINEFIRNHFEIAAESRFLTRRIKADFDDIPKEKWSISWPEADAHIHYDYMETDGSPPAKLVSVCFFASALVAAIGNTLSNMYMLGHSGSIKISWNREAVCIENPMSEPLEPGKLISEGTEMVLRRNVRIYAREKEDSLYFRDYPVGSTQWLTRLPLPAGFITD